ncbi:hypothetical protein DOY81_014397, partial [Sarcophaga bullata]
IFILTNYNIGCPSNNVLLKQCRQSLNSILGKGDLHKYVLRKKYHRLEYLQKLGATAAGILIFNNQSDQCKKEHIRDTLIPHFVYSYREIVSWSTKTHYPKSHQSYNTSEYSSASYLPSAS